MSRSISALRFKETVGLSPMEYLTRWRMLLAGDRMANTRVVKAQLSADSSRSLVIRVIPGRECLL